MTPLFSLPVSVEPDRQRFARFALEAVRGLDGSLFAAAPRLLEVLPAMRRGDGSGDAQAHLLLQGSTLSVLFAGRQWELCTLPRAPAAGRPEQLREQLRKASETADPELLKRRNQQIQDDLERYMRNTREQMAAVEAALERKKAELRESIRLAQTDGLTGLLNRGAYDERLPEAVARCGRQGHPLSLVLLDLDEFKRINDTHGHQWGDRHLKRMAQAMAGAVRGEVDQLFRIGGDEFAMLIFADAAVAARIAEAVLKAMDFGVSIGIAQLADAEPVEDLVARADAALYAAKRQGRGRVVRHEAMAPAPPSLALQGGR